MITLEGKVAVVTGAGSGIGRATAQVLAAAGAIVSLLDRDESALTQANAELLTAGYETYAHVVDVTDDAGMATALQQLARDHGRLDIVHNNAGLLGSAADDAVAATDLSVWDRTLSVNLMGVVIGCRHAVPLMLAHGRGGAIINTASVGGLMGNLTRHAYNASKAAVISLTQNIATAYGRFGVRCNAVAPGFVTTPQAKSLFDPDQLKMLENNTPSPQLGSPDDIARAVAFLASDLATFVNGHTLVVDGGFSCHFPYYADLLRTGAAPASR